MLNGLILQSKFLMMKSVISLISLLDPPPKTKETDIDLIVNDTEEIIDYPFEVSTYQCSLNINDKTNIYHICFFVKENIVYGAINSVFPDQDVYLYFVQDKLFIKTYSPEYSICKIKIKEL